MPSLIRHFKERKESWCYCLVLFFWLPTPENFSADALGYFIELASHLVDPIEFLKKFST